MLLQPVRGFKIDTTGGQNIIWVKYANGGQDSMALLDSDAANLGAFITDPAATGRNLYGNVYIFGNWLNDPASPDIDC